MVKINSDLNILKVIKNMKEYAIYCELNLDSVFVN